MRALTAALCLVAMLAAAWAMSPLRATADPAPPPGTGASGDCHLIDESTGLCRTEVTIPPAPDGPGAPGSDGQASTEQASAHNDEGKPACFWTDGGRDRAVPCSTEDGYWSNELGCYVSPTPMEPQPPSGGRDGAVDPLTGEELSDDGAYYECFVPSGGAGVIWLDEPPSAEDAPPTPGEVARRAVAKLKLRAIEIGMAPEPGQAAVVGVPVWLWVADPSASTFGTATESATVRGVSVTVRARAAEVVWDLGDGTTFSCGASTPYEARFGASASPDCGHVYSRESGGQPGGAFTVTATTTWEVVWSGAGQTGTITLDPLVSEAEVVVAEGQVLVS